MSENNDKQLTLHIKEFTPEMIFPTTDQMYEPSSWGTKMVVIGKPACFERGTKILMFNGQIKNVEDVEIGEYVMGDDSTERKVLTLSHGIDKMYKIVPKIGDPVIVNSNHIITIVKIKGNNKGQLIDISVSDYLKLSPKVQTSYNWIRVPVQFAKQNQKIDPYILGFFIDGDYSFIKREFIKKHFQISDESIDKLIEKNVPVVPNHILYSNIEDRSQYLAGMLDARATYNATTKRFDIPLPSEELCDQVMYLAGSIGYYNSKIKNFKSNFFTQTQQVIWSCYIYVNTNTLLKSKVFDINYIKTMFSGMFTTDFYIVESGMDEYFGFTIDGNHRFLLGDFSITHNSGKCMGKGTPVLKYDGTIVPIENVKVGDVLLSDTSQPQTVLELYQGHGDLFKIKQNKGMDYIVNSEHILTLKHDNKIIDICIQDVLKKLNGKHRFYGVKNVFQFPNVPVDIESFAYGKQLNFIDIDKYIINDIETRTQLVKGIIVGLNGVYNHHNHAICIKLGKWHNELMVNKLIFLFYSLGYYPCVSYKHNSFNIWVYGNVGKLIDVETRNIKRRYSSHTRISIEYHGKGDYYGFELSGNRRYTLGNDCTITHNTYAITSLLYQKRHIFPFGMVFSGTEKVTGYWGKIFPDSFVFPNLQLSRITDFLRQQELNKKHLQNPWSVLLLDDCAFESKLFKSELFKEIFNNGRHYKFWLILSLQYPSEIAPCLRQNIDYTFIYKNNNINERKKIYENYASVIPSFNLFCAIMDEVTKDYTALVIDNLSQSTDFQDCIYWFRAPPFPEDFKFGSVDYWNHHYIRYSGNSSS
jgi:hypothetical protein